MCKYCLSACSTFFLRSYVSGIYACACMCNARFIVLLVFPFRPLTFTSRFVVEALYIYYSKRVQDSCVIFVNQFHKVFTASKLIKNEGKPKKTKRGRSKEIVRENEKSIEWKRWGEKNYGMKTIEKDKNELQCVLFDVYRKPSHRMSSL